MSVEIGTETAQFPEKENIKGFSLQCTQYAALTYLYTKTEELLFCAGSYLRFYDRNPYKN